MGNCATRQLTGKVILSNGGVFTYEKPTTVAELMLEHPQQVVVEFQAVLCGKKPIPLPADKRLEMEKLYIMLPVRKGRPAPLSTEEARKLLEKSNYSVLKSANCTSGMFLHWFGGDIDAGRKQGDGEEKCVPWAESDLFSDVLEGRPEYLKRQISGKGWKPSLDPIREKAVVVKVRHWLF